jgi:hypothetical protein
MSNPTNNPDYEYRSKRFQEELKALGEKYKIAPVATIHYGQIAIEPRLSLVDLVEEPQSPIITPDAPEIIKAA